MKKLFISIIILISSSYVFAQERIIWDSDPSDGDAPCIVLATGHFLPCTPGGAPDLSAEPFITKTTSANLSAEFALSSLATGILLNTTGTGIPTIYAGTSCTNQFPRSLNASGVATCASVDIAADVSGLGTGVATFLGTPTSANFLSAISDEVGSGTKVAKFDSVSGNSGVAAQSSGTLTSGNLAKFDASGNIVDSGATATSATFSGACVYNSSNVTISNNTETAMTADTETYENLGCGYDTDNYHFTSAANLTGTVSKTSTSTTITGSGTSFTTELSVGQVIKVPGTTTEYFVVTAIGTNTSLTVSKAATQTASGQTATRQNSTFTIPTTAYYDITCHVSLGTSATGARAVSLYVVHNATVYALAAEDMVPAQGSFNHEYTFTAHGFKLSANDIAECRVYQNSTGSLTLFNRGGATPYSSFIQIQRAGQ